MKKYYARYKNGLAIDWWVIYRKRKYWFDKKVSKFFSSPATRSREVFKEIVEPELERLEKEEK